MPKKFLIGGLCFNQTPLNCLFKLNLNFIDINLLPTPFSLNDMANHVIQQLNPEGNNILFGYSTGGLVAIHVASLLPDMVKQIILINSTPKFMQEDNWEGIKSEEYNKMLVKLNNLKLIDFMSYFASFAAYPKKIKSKVYRHFFSKTNKATLLNLMNILHTTDFRPQLQQLQDKTVLINSDYDVLIARNSIATKQIYLPDSTHLEPNEEYLLKTINQVLCSKN